jgi:hypothetical protein
LSAGTATAAGASSPGTGAPPELEIVPQGPESIAALPYDKLLIEEIEISYDATSPYRRLKPQHEARITEAAMQAIRAAVGERFTVVEEPGPGVLCVRAARARRLPSSSGLGAEQGASWPTRADRSGLRLAAARCAVAPGLSAPPALGAATPAVALAVICDSHHRVVRESQSAVSGMGVAAILGRRKRH